MTARERSEHERVIADDLSVDPRCPVCGGCRLRTHVVRGNCRTNPIGLCYGVDDTAAFPRNTKDDKVNRAGVYAPPKKGEGILAIGPTVRGDDLPSQVDRFAPHDFLRIDEIADFTLWEWRDGRLEIEINANEGTFGCFLNAEQCAAMIRQITPFAGTALEGE